MSCDVARLNCLNKTVYLFEKIHSLSHSFVQSIELMLCLDCYFEGIKKIGRICALFLFSLWWFSYNIIRVCFIIIIKQHEAYFVFKSFSTSRSIDRTMISNPITFLCFILTQKYSRTICQHYKNELLNICQRVLFFHPNAGL